jgi:L-threonylcarbamoyladenylate synthase
MLSRHYAPRAPLECTEGDGNERVEELARQGLRVGWLTFAEGRGLDLTGVVVWRLPPEPVAYGARLYAALHMLDAAGVDRIVVELPPQGQKWLAVHDRLRRASAS